MPRICPHCNHVRKADATVPDWQCPACEKAYDKAAAPLPSPGGRDLGSGALPARRSAGGRWLLILVALGAALWFGRPLLQPAVSPLATASANQPEVLLYATEWCGYCKMTREFFAANGIRYTEHDIEKSSEALKQHRKLGGNGVPLIVVGDNVIRGWNEGALRQLLQPWIKG